MSAGDKELFQMFEETTRRNVQAAVDFSNETRQIVRELEEKVRRLEEQIRSKESEMQQIRTMLSTLQSKVYAGGSA